MQDLHFQILSAFISLGQEIELTFLEYPSALVSFVSSAYLCIKEIVTGPEEEQTQHTALETEAHILPEAGTHLQSCTSQVNGAGDMLKTVSVLSSQCALSTPKGQHPPCQRAIHPNDPRIPFQA